MIALLEREFVETKKWVDHDEFLDVVAIAESTPGPVAINFSTYIGYKVAGFGGALLSTLAMCLPSFVIIYLISLFFDAFLSLEYVGYAFKGIQVCVVYLILSTGIRMIAQMKKTPFNVAVMGIVIVAMVLFALFAVNFSTIFYILGFGLVGLLVYLIGRIRRKEKRQ